MSAGCSNSKEVVVWTFILTISYILTTLLNNSIYSYFGCNYWAIQFVNYAVAFTFLLLLTCCGILNYEHIPLSNILPLAVTETFISISTSILLSNGSEQDMVLVRSADFAIHLLVIFMADKLLNFSFRNDLPKTGITVFIIICSTIAWSTNFCFNKSLIIGWPMLTIASVAHYFLAVKTSQQLNVPFEMITMHISGFTSLFIFPFALLITSDPFLRDFEDGFGHPWQPYHYMTFISATILIPLSFLSKYWLIKYINPRDYINVQNFKQACALSFKWTEEEFLHTNSINISALLGVYFGTLLTALFKLHDNLTDKSFGNSSNGVLLANHKMIGNRFTLKRKIIIATIYCTILSIFFVYRNGMKDYSVRLSQNVVDDDYIADWEADDIRLIEHIRKFYMEPPSQRHVPYNLLNQGNRDWSPKSQSTFVENYFKRKSNGFFIECGAADGEYMSNTLSLEKYLNWTGILIEPDYGNFQKLKAKKRKSWLVNSCLIDSNKPIKKILHGAFFIGSLAEYTPFIKHIFTQMWHDVNIQSVWCFPLLSIMKAVNQTKVDYFSLDVEGPEIRILKNVHWHQLDISLLQVEYAVLKSTYIARDLSKKRKSELRSFMKENLSQYQEIKVILYDIIFAKINGTLQSKLIA